MDPGGSMPHSQGLSNNAYPEPNQPNSSRNMVSYIKGEMQAKGIWKQDPEANIYFIVCTVHLT